MEMQIAAMSMAMAQQNTSDALAIKMMKMTMESSEASMDMITDMIDNIPSPDGRGQLLNMIV